MRYRIIVPLWLALWIGIGGGLFVGLEKYGALTIGLAIAGVIGVGAISWPLRHWDARTKKHSLELGRLYDTPGIFVGGLRTAESTIPGFLDQARSHLRAYPTIDRLIQDYEAESTAARRAEGEFDNYLRQVVNERLRSMYPGVAEWSMSGDEPNAYTLPERVVQDIKLDFAQYSASGHRLGLAVNGEEKQGRWRVFRGSGPTYAVVKNKDAGKETEMQAFVDHVVEGPELRRLKEVIDSSNKPAWKHQGQAQQEIRQLGDRIRHGHRVEGVCRLGY